MINVSKFLLNQLKATLTVLGPLFGSPDWGKEQPDLNLLRGDAYNTNTLHPDDEFLGTLEAPRRPSFLSSHLNGSSPICVLPVGSLCFTMHRQVTRSFGDTCFKVHEDSTPKNPATIIAGPEGAQVC